MKTKVKITEHPFRLQGADGCFFCTKVITPRIPTRTYEITPIMYSMLLFGITGDRVDTYLRKGLK